MRWLAIALLLLAAPARAEDPWAALRSPDATVLMLRHAEAPGIGDPPGYRLEDCATQRNLDANGRDQARGIGVRLRAQHVAIAAVLTSAWCRCTEIARLAFRREPTVDAAFNSFFDDRDRDAEATRAATRLIAAWRGPGTLAIVTHQVNITALTGIVPASGEGVVLRPSNEGFAVVGRLKP